MKVYSFIELLTAIKNGEIAEGTEFWDISSRAKYRYENKNFNSRYGGCNIIALLNHEFTLIEENTTDEIEELTVEEMANIDGMQHIRIMNKINKIIDVVNKINKEIQELKEDKQC